MRHAVGLEMSLFVLAYPRHAQDLLDLRLITSIVAAPTELQDHLFHAVKAVQL